MGKFIRFKPNQSKYNGILNYIADDGSITWYMSGSVNGIPFGPVKIPGAKLNGEEAVKKRIKYINDLAAGKKADGGDLKFAEAYPLWQDWAQENLKDKTYRAMRYRYEKHVRRSINRIRLVEMDEPLARKLIRKWQRKGQAPPTQKQNIAVINSIYKAMRELGYWEGKSPLFGLRIDKSKRRRVVTLTVEECETLLLEFKKTRLHYYWMMALMYYGGLRPSEVLKLRPMDIKMRQGHILIPDVKTPAGNYKTRTVWFKDDPDFTRIVKEILAGLPRKNNKRFFPKNLDTAYVAGIFKKCGYNHNIDSKDMVNRVTPYTFRHSYATQALEYGANIKDVQKMLGHDSLQSTMVYLKAANNAAQRGQKTLAEARAASTGKPELQILKGGK